MPPRIDYDVALGGRSDPKYRVLVLTEHVNATYYISFQFAFEQLASAGELSAHVLCEATVERSIQSLRSEADLAAQLVAELRPNRVVFSRFAHPFGVTLLRACRRERIPVIYHVDDDLLNLPLDLGPSVLGRHANPVVLATRRALLTECDLIYASTRHLQSHLARQFPSQRTYSGMYAPFLALDPLQQTSERESRRHFTIGYMGSKGHAHDLSLVTPSLKAILRQNEDVRFETFGTIKVPSELAAYEERTLAHTALIHYPSFLNRLATLDWDVGIAPLRAIEFNHSKAPTKYIEYSMCGIPTLASDVDVYASVVPDGGGLLVRDDGWCNALMDVIDGRWSLRGWVDTARRRCAERFSLQRLQVQLLEVLSSVSAGSAP